MKEIVRFAMIDAQCVSLETESKDFHGTRKNLEECEENARTGIWSTWRSRDHHHVEDSNGGQHPGRQESVVDPGHHQCLAMAEVSSTREDC